MLPNSQLYVDWLQHRDLTGLPTPGPEGYFYRKSQRCILPYFRAYWKAPRPPKWQPDRWTPVAKVSAKGEVVIVAFSRYLRADQALDFIADYHPQDTQREKFCSCVLRAFRGRRSGGWMVVVDEPLLQRPDLLARRVEAIVVREVSRGRRQPSLDWSRSAREFDLRTRFAAAQALAEEDKEKNEAALVETELGDDEDSPNREIVALGKHAAALADLSGAKGLDLVHTPESERAGLTNYLCQGWRISDEGKLEGVDHWGPSTSQIPYQLANDPKRLMLGASLQAKAVPLEESDIPKESSGAPVPGRNLRVAFSAGEGFTHEDAVVISETAACKLQRPSIEESQISLLIPAIVSRVQIVREGQICTRGTALLQAEIDLFALGWRRHALDSLHTLDGRKVEAADGWLKIAIPGSEAQADLEILEVNRKSRLHTFWREEITIRARQQFPRPRLMQIGDKLATRHGIKGVVSRILPDDEMPGGAEILLSPFGVRRRKAMGQFREAAGGEKPEELPHSGTIFVVRQPQDAASKLSFVGPRHSIKSNEGARGQRYGWMEFAALMSHGASHLAEELLSTLRSTAGWMFWEEAKSADLDELLRAWAARENPHKDSNHRPLAREALNHYLELIGAKLDGHRILAPPKSSGILAVRDEQEDTYLVPPGTETRAKEVLEHLTVPEWWKERGGHVAIDLRASQLTLSLGDLFTSKEERGELQSKGLSLAVEIQYHAFPLLPPWFRPGPVRGPHPLTKIYKKLLEAVQNSQHWEKDGKALLRTCIRMAFEIGDENKGSGAETFVLREILGRRLTRSARGVVVPDPSLPLDTIRIPQSVADAIFKPPAQQSLVLVHRNPLLHRRGLLALKPRIDEGECQVFRLPLGILGVMGADFDGDTIAVVAIETDKGLEDAKLMVPGACKDLRADPFRVDSWPAYPLVNELTVIEKEIELAGVGSEVAPAKWCRDHLALVQEQIAELVDRETRGELIPAWSDEKEDKECKQLYFDKVALDSWLKKARQVMLNEYRKVRAKGQLGGILRWQFYRLAYDAGEFERFRRGLEASQAVTERLTQTALGKRAAEVSGFTGRAFFRNPVKFKEGKSKEAFLGLDPDRPFDAGKIIGALGEQREPTGVLAWLASPTLPTLLQLIFDESVNTSPAVGDPRVAWYV